MGKPNNSRDEREGRQKKNVGRDRALTERSRSRDSNGQLRSKTSHTSAHSPVQPQFLSCRLTEQLYYLYDKFVRDINDCLAAVIKDHGVMAQKIKENEHEADTQNRIMDGLRKSASCLEGVVKEMRKMTLMGVFKKSDGNKISEKRIELIFHMTKIAARVHGINNDAMTYKLADALATLMVSGPEFSEGEKTAVIVGFSNPDVHPLLYTLVGHGVHLLDNRHAAYKLAKASYVNPEKVKALLVKGNQNHPVNRADWIDAIHKEL